MVRDMVSRKTVKTVIGLSNVSKRYPLGEVFVDALKNISLEIHEGELVSIMGPSGSGKSTLLNVMGLLTEPTSGRIILDHKDVSKLHEDARAYIRGKKIGFVCQTFNLIPTFNAIENVAVPMAFYGIDKKTRLRMAENFLKSVGLEERMYSKPSQLSGGERQRVAIARSLGNNPDIILADEPTGNLDSVSGKQILDLFLKLNREGKTVVIVTHDESITKKTKRTLFLRDGELHKEVKKR